MQLKRIVITLLVAVMMISMAVLATSAAETEGVSFVIAVENSDSEGNIAVVPGETVEVPVIITNNPGVAYTAFRVRYDESVMDYVKKTDGEIYAITTVSTGEGIVYISTDDGAADSEATGLILTLTFAVDESFVGEKTSVVIDYVRAYTESYDIVNAEAVNGELPCPHENVEEIVETPATCVEDGEAVVKCKDCGETVGDPVVIPATGEHTPGEKATCIVAQVCTVCGEELAPVVDHTEEITPAVDATCTEAGLSEGKKCTVCGEILAAQETVDALGHTEEVLAAVAATCTEAGLTEGKKCSVCGTVTTEQTVVAAKGHTEVAIEAVVATCTAAGSTEGKKCSVCGAITVAPEVVQPTGHTLEEIPAVEPTYSEAGATAGSRCTVCGEIIDTPDEIPAKSLTWLWVLIVCVVVVGGGAAAFYFLYWKKRPAK